MQVLHEHEYEYTPLSPPPQIPTLHVLLRYRLIDTSTASPPIYLPTLVLFYSRCRQSYNYLSLAPASSLPKLH